MKHKNFIHSLLLAAGLLTTTSASAYDFEYNGVFYAVISSEEGTCRTSIDDDPPGTVATYKDTAIVIPETVYDGNKKYTVVTIGYQTFYSSSNLRSITLPSTIKTIADRAFHNCSSLKSITLPNSVTTIGDSSFEGCSALEEITIPANVTSIGEDCFKNCLTLENVYIADGTDRLIVGRSLFENCLLKEVYLGRTFRYDSDLGFGCPFYGQARLSTVTISNTVTELPESLFQNCTLLSSIALPASIEYIDNYVFSGCGRLNDIYCLSTTPPIAATYMCGLSLSSQATLHVPNGSLEAYKQDITWGKFKNIVEFDPTGIADGTTAPGSLSLSAHDGTLRIDGLPQGTPVEVYTTDGKLVYQGTATDVALPEGGLYIIRAAGQTGKIIL